MKKIVILLAIVCAVGSASAQSWSAGVRMGSGLEAVGQRYKANGNYYEARLGLGGWRYGTATLEFGVLHCWRMGYMDWTSRGDWFFDLGAGATLGTGSNLFVFGVQGMAKLGYEFEGAPVSLSLDWSPAFGPKIDMHPRREYVDGSTVNRSLTSSFNVRGIASIGVSCIYHF